MFHDIGDKIKSSAECLFFCGSVASTIGGIILLALGGEYMRPGIFLILCTPLALLLISYVVYGFGEMVETVCSCAELYFKSKEREEEKEKKQKENLPVIVTEEDEVIAKLEKLAKLKEIGAISEEEYNKKKEEILDRI